jgi:hypothetical protein
MTIDGNQHDEYLADNGRCEASLRDQDPSLSLFIWRQQEDLPDAAFLP